MAGGKLRTEVNKITTLGWQWLRNLETAFARETWRYFSRDGNPDALIFQSREPFGRWQTLKIRLSERNTRRIAKTCWSLDGTIAWRKLLHHATDAPVWDEGIELLSATTEWLGLAARCDLRTADRLVQFVHEFSDLPEPHRDDVGSAFREMLLNAVEHGGNLDPSQHVVISYV